MIAFLDADDSYQFPCDQPSVVAEGQITWVKSKPDITDKINAQTAVGMSATGSDPGDYEDSLVVYRIVSWHDSMRVDNMPYQSLY